MADDSKAGEKSASKPARSPPPNTGKVASDNAEKKSDELSANGSAGELDHRELLQILSPFARSSA
jgi:hypothetical protein